MYFDGRLAEAALKVAQAARAKGIPVLVEAERLRPGLNDLLAQADYVVTSAKFPQARSCHKESLQGEPAHCSPTTGSWPQHCSKAAAACTWYIYWTGPGPLFPVAAHGRMPSRRGTCTAPTHFSVIL